MASTVAYVVQAGDWLMKVAERHGTTVQAIWSHPENAAHRAKRGSPDVLYPGDVLHVPVADVAPPVEPPPIEPVPPASTPTTVPVDAPWHYEAPVRPWTTKPTWDCSEGLCACHPPIDDEPRHEHLIVFYDPQGVRMAGARCRVYEQGQLITEEPTTTNGLGELTVEIRASTSTLRLEWAPPDLPLRPAMPYRKLYHVRLGVELALATDRRLSNLGFSQGRRREDNVKDYQRAYGEAETGDYRHVAGEVAERHDQGLVPVFPPQPRADFALDQDVGVEKAFFANPQRMGFAPVNAKSFVGDTLPSPPGSATPPSGGQNPQGSSAPEVGHVLVMVALSPSVTPLNLADISVRLRPLSVPGMTAEELDKIIQPTMPGAFWDDGARTHVVFSFQDILVGRYAALAHIGNLKTSRVGYALGSAELEVKRGLLTLGFIPAEVDRPILTVADPLLDLDLPMMQRRRKVLATIFRFFPQSRDFRAGAKGVRPPYHQGEYKRMLAFKEGEFQHSCAPINAAIMSAAVCPAGVQVETLRPPPGFGSTANTSPGFVKYQKGLAPSVGDTFNLIDTVEGVRQFHHCGIVVQSSLDSNRLWLTADGGQPDRTEDFKQGGDGWARHYLAPEVPPGFQSFEAAYVVPRRFLHDPSDPGLAVLGNLFISPTDATGGYYVEGWVDITHPGVVFKNPAYDKVYGTEEDYRRFKKLALSIPGSVFSDLDQCASTQGVASLSAQLGRP